MAIMRPIMRRLRPIFGPYGCIQFMHCETGSGPAGRTMLEAIASDTRVPVSAGLHTQFGGGLKTFRCEGPTLPAVRSEDQRVGHTCVRTCRFAFSPTHLTKT